MSDKVSEWEVVVPYLQRITVPGGWLYIKYSEHIDGQCMVFVPAPSVSDGPAPSPNRQARADALREAAAYFNQKCSDRKGLGLHYGAKIDAASRDQILAMINNPTQETKI